MSGRVPISSSPRPTAFARRVAWGFVATQESGPPSIVKPLWLNVTRLPPSRGAGLDEVHLAGLLGLLEGVRGRQPGDPPADDDDPLHSPLASSAADDARTTAASASTSPSLALSDGARRSVIPSSSAQPRASMSRS